MITVEKMNANREQFLTLLDQVQIEGADIAGLKTWLDNSDFFYAPASTQYHLNCEGGLCQHSLNVYNNLLKLTQLYMPGAYDGNSLKIVGLLHDLAKVDFYESFVVNKKKYYDGGSKHDNMGNFDWYSEEAYKVKDVKERFLGGEHGFNSMILINQYIPMTYEETLAVLHHHFGVGEAKQLSDLSAIVNKWPLVALLHTADFLSTYIDERE